MAQPLAIGVLGGIRATDDVIGTLHPESQRYIVGPKLEVHLPLRFSFEFDALYRKVGFTGYESSCCGSSITRERDNSWEFPVILKYRLPGVPLAFMNLLHPFVGVGYAPRVVHGSDVSSGNYLSGMTANPPASVYTYFFNSRSNTSYSTTHGLVVSGGVEFGTGHLRISPEVRYVHWNKPFLNEFGGDGSFAFASPQNEAFVMLGIAWR